MNSLTLAAAVVDVTGNVKATQPLGAIKNLKPQQVNRKEIPIRVTVIAPTDRVVFFVKEVKSETGDWNSVDAEVAALIKAAALQFRFPESRSSAKLAVSSRPPWFDVFVHLSELGFTAGEPALNQLEQDHRSRLVDRGTQEGKDLISFINSVGEKLQPQYHLLRQG